MADAALGDLTGQRDKLQAEVTVKVSDYQKLRASIAARRDEVERKVKALDQFDFNVQESVLTRELADEIEQEIATNNELLYAARFDLGQITRGLQEDIQFDLTDVERVFTEAKIAFPDQLRRSYSELVDFNRRILDERHGFLRHRAIQLRTEIEELEKANADLSDRRRTILQVIGGTDSLRKFKDLQRQLDSDRAGLALMEEKAEKLVAIRALNEELRVANTRCEELTIEIERLIADGGPIYSEIQRLFSRIVNDVLHRSAVLYAKQNESGNPDFHAEFTDSDTDVPTQERRGTSFRQILCIAFDLAVLIAYSKDRFFHFVYHDGGLERLENKRKLALLQIVRNACNQHGIQYIFSALEEDLPPMGEAPHLLPTTDEIILQLHDDGDDGRLFKVETF